MSVRNAPTETGKKSAEGLERSAKAEERKTEAEQGHPLKKGAERFDERSKSSDGKSAADKQR